MIPWDFINANPLFVGALLPFVWLMWQLHCPLPNHTTKLQGFQEALTHRMKTIEVGQIGLAEEVEGANEERYREIHGEEQLTTSELKQGD